MDKTNVALQELEAELKEVEQTLHEALTELFPPFSQMVAQELRRTYPLQRGALVLAAGMPAQDDEAARRRRIDLAAALEMLHLAINVHIRLGEADRGGAAYSSVLGSTILAGDYCFSRAAALAVRTGERVVVEIFSDVLKRISEGHLRQLLEGGDASFDEDRELFIAGADAAIHLAQNAPPVRTMALHLAGLLATHEASEQAAPFWNHAQKELQPLLTPTQSARWKAFLDWRQSIQ
ncbi:polyprenyl synthetase family protein [Caldilinea sp.]|uniref:polyprenyl synthetase family protein n=1 Tax=Caldilinea sp. TaxID=2293560 RepID=UPI0021DD972D|nr:polyprenyl synthetase family protein [Caldilinea sp.]GIV67598.1 MAG: hypothetical protein KatS3mg048_0460 [Caldilinea sp.]